jgi:CHAT domain-containing protein
MKGVSIAAYRADRGLYCPIAFGPEQINLGYHQFPRGLTDDQLLSFTDQALDAFADIEQMVVARDSIDLKADDGRRALKMLARWGSRTYRELFNGEAREVLNFDMPPLAPGEQPWRPTFISEQAPFLWELLYDGDHYQDGDPNMFWGLRTAPARVLDLRRDNFRYAGEQAPPADMLFCLHYRLRQAHMTEWPAIEKLVRATAEDSFTLLRASVGPSAEHETRIKDGEALLRYLDAAPHNMVHFACHCRQLAAGNDALEVSVGPDGQTDPQLISLETYTFTDAGAGDFLRQPLVFLNACQAAGGADSLRKVFNLPRKFVERGAGAVVAAACPVPDRFAAAFASQFYRFFLGKPHMAIGEALREARWYFLREHNNPLGLAYGLYTPAHYRVAAPPAATGGGS